MWGQFLTAEFPLKIIYFTLKVLFVIEIFNFFPNFFSHTEKGLDKKAMINSKFMTLTEKEISTIAQYLNR